MLRRAAVVTKPHRLGLGAIAVGVPLACAAYDYATQAYARMILGAAATEQLWMQKLEGTVELELTVRRFCSVGELRGMLSPVLYAPHISMSTINHRAFTLIESPDFNERSGLSARTRARQAEANKGQLPPTAMKRDVQVCAPLCLLPALFGSKELRFFVRKSRSQTEYFSEANRPEGFASDLVLTTE